MPGFRRSIRPSTGLMVHGLVERPLIFTMEDVTRFPSVSRIHFLECSGNTQNWGAPKPELTAQDTHGLLCLLRMDRSSAFDRARGSGRQA